MPSNYSDLIFKNPIIYFNLVMRNSFRFKLLLSKVTSSCFKRQIFFNMGTIRFFLLIGLFCIATLTFAQNRRSSVLAPPLNIPDTNKKITVGARDTNINHTSQFFTLRQCIDYALLHQPALNRSLINVNITKETNAVNLAAWLPQVNATGNLIHYIQVPKNNVAIAPSGTGTTATTTGRSAKANTFVPELAVSQAIFCPSLLSTH